MCVIFIHHSHPWKTWLAISLEIYHGSRDMLFIFWHIFMYKLIPMRKYIYCFPPTISTAIISTKYSRICSTYKGELYKIHHSLKKKSNFRSLILRNYKVSFGYTLNEHQLYYDSYLFCLSFNATSGNQALFYFLSSLCKLI